MRVLSYAIALLLVSASGALAQVRTKADLTPLVENDAAPGTSVRAALQVRLPSKELHVQSNKPRDPSLIPTVLTVTPPEGVRVAEIVFPKPTDLAQEGQPEPLAVFDHEFAIGVRFDVASTVAPGAIEIPARLRYQACDDRMCYAPASANVVWTLNVGTAGAPAHADVFSKIPFGTGEAPPAPAGPKPPALEAASGNGLSQLDGFTTLGSTGGYLGRDDFLQFVSNAENGVVERGLFEGRGPLAVLLLVFLGGLALNLTPCVLPMIPINLAIIGAGAQAGSRARGFLLGSVYGAAMAVVYGILGVIVILTA
jgi:hypothetical protein